MCKADLSINRSTKIKSEKEGNVIIRKVFRTFLVDLR